VAEIMARELGKDQAWVNSQVAIFIRLAEQYMLH
jgi:hypothetical protein